MKLLMLSAFALLMTVSAAYPQRRSPTEDRNGWIVSVIRETSKIKPGMTRADLLKIFGEEGGISTPLERTYVYKSCPYVKVRVEFSLFGRPERDSDGRVTSVEDARDIIKSISKPYLEYMIMD